MEKEYFKCARLALSSHDKANLNKPLLDKAVSIFFSAFTPRLLCAISPERASPLICQMYSMLCSGQPEDVVATVFLGKVASDFQLLVPKLALTFAYDCSRFSRQITGGNKDNVVSLKDYKLTLTK